MTQEPEPTAEEVAATQAAAALAAEHGVDLAEVEGTGVDGTVTKPDVADHVAAAAEESAADAPTVESLHARIDALVAKLGGILGTNVEG